MTRDQPFEENIMEKLRRMCWRDNWQTGAARDTALDETVIRDAKGGIARLRCMIITVKKGRQALPTGFPGDYRMSGGERILPAWPENPFRAYKQ